MGLLMNRHIKKQQLQMLEKKIDACDEKIEKLEKSIEATELEKATHMKALKTQRAQVAKDEKKYIAQQEKLEKKRKEEAAARAKAVVNMKHPDAPKEPAKDEDLDDTNPEGGSENNTDEIPAPLGSVEPNVDGEGEGPGELPNEGE